MNSLEEILIINLYGFFTAESEEVILLRHLVLNVWRV